MLPLNSHVDGIPAKYSIFTVKIGQEAADIELAFDFEAEFCEKHFIVACDMTCVKEVFHQVNSIQFIYLFTYMFSIIRMFYYNLF